jgi:CheY-like chemotaxis protein
MLPRVLLVEDDAAVRRLVQLALEDMALELVACADVPQALAALAAAPVQLVLTDLMMPGVSGLVLLERLSAEPALRRETRCVVFSAGLDAGLQDRLQALGVWRQLHKPVSVQALRDCVTAGLAAVDAGPATPAAAAAADETSLVARHFAGDAALFQAFRRSCQQQFRADAAAGDLALQNADVQTLRHLGHSLKSVLESLGETQLADRACALEAAAVAADQAALAVHWPALAQGLRRLADEGGR